MTLKSSSRSDSVVALTNVTKPHMQSKEWKISISKSYSDSHLEIIDKYENDLLQSFQF